ncbi:MAG: IS3 family transposase [Candidatus Thiodiazotropha lotti]|nr:IS3 family transposase [Candidatus Thiodiazotropha lotti]
MLLERIRSIHQVSRQAYGSPRVYRSLKASGITVGKNRVARIMRENGIQGRVVTVTRRAPGLRQFQQDGKNLRLQSSFPKAKRISGHSPFEKIIQVSLALDFLPLYDTCPYNTLKRQFSKG